MIGSSVRGQKHTEHQSLPRFRSGQTLQEQLTAGRLNHILEYIESIQPLDSVDIAHARYQHGTISYLKSPDKDIIPDCRFEMVFQGELGEILINKGTVYFCDESSGLFDPVLPTISTGAEKVSIYSEPPPKFAIDALSVGINEMWIFFGLYEAEIQIIGPTDELPDTGNGKYGLKIGEFEVRTRAVPTDDGRTLHVVQESIKQYLCSDIVISDANVASSSPSSSVASGSGSAFSSGSSQGSDSDGSGKSAIVPVPTSVAETGFIAWFLTEMPEVRFEDILEVDVKGRSRVEVPVTDKVLASIEAGTLGCCGWAADEPCFVGVKCNPKNFSLRIFALPWMRPTRVTMRLTAIRRGFGHLRNPNRTKEEFDANEAFLQLAKPKPKDKDHDLR